MWTCAVHVCACHLQYQFVLVGAVHTVANETHSSPVRFLLGGKMQMIANETCKVPCFHYIASMHTWKLQCCVPTSYCFTTACTKQSCKTRELFLSVLLKCQCAPCKDMARITSEVSTMCPVSIRDYWIAACSRKRTHMHENTYIYVYI